MQVEAHPYWPNTPLIGWAAGQGLHVTAYSPLGSPDSATLLNRARHTTAPAGAPAGSSSDGAGAAAAAAVEAPQLMQHPMVMEMARRHSKSSAQVSNLKQCVFQQYWLSGICVHEVMFGCPEL
jgi:diketogulonate reductase-like aldo/keto reductase